MCMHKQGPGVYKLLVSMTTGSILITTIRGALWFVNIPSIALAALSCVYTCSWQRATHKFCLAALLTLCILNIASVLGVGITLPYFDDICDPRYVSKIHFLFFLIIANRFLIQCVWNLFH